MSPEELRLRIREVPDYPKPGILFKDITPLLADAVAWRAAIDAMTAPWVEEGITHVVAVESRGFLFGGALAARLEAGLVPVRKRGKLPYQRSREEYALEYGTDVLELHVDAVGQGSSVLIVDDVLATGGTAAAAIRLVERHGAHVAGCGFLIELGFLGGRHALGKRIERVIEY
jgi:adenine phosphoribosyltransferase